MVIRVSVPVQVHFLSWGFEPYIIIKHQMLLLLWFYYLEILDWRATRQNINNTVKYYLHYWHLPPIISSIPFNRAGPRSFWNEIFSCRRPAVSARTNIETWTLCYMHVDCCFSSVPACVDDAMSQKYFPSSLCGILSETETAPCNLKAIPWMGGHGQMVKYEDELFFGKTEESKYKLSDNFLRNIHHCNCDTIEWEHNWFRNC